MKNGWFGDTIIFGNTQLDRGWWIGDGKIGKTLKKWLNWKLIRSISTEVVSLDIRKTSRAKHPRLLHGSVWKFSNKQSQTWPSDLLNLQICFGLWNLIFFNHSEVYLRDIYPPQKKGGVGRLGIICGPTFFKGILSRMSQICKF